MRIDEEGITLNRNEIVALLAFANDSPERLEQYGVKFVADGARIVARATDGAVALEANGECDGTVGEWFVHRDFLDRARKAMDRGTELRLEFEGASIHSAALLSDSERISTLEWPTDAALTQVTFPEVDKFTTKPKRRATFRSLTLSANYLSLLKKVAAAAGVDGITAFPPEGEDSPAKYVCSGPDTETEWIAVIMPMRSENGAASELGMEAEVEIVETYEPQTEEWAGDETWDGEA